MELPRCSGMSTAVIDAPILSQTRFKFSAFDQAIGMNVDQSVHGPLSGSNLFFNDCSLADDSGAAKRRWRAPRNNQWQANRLSCASLNWKPPCPKKGTDRRTQRRTAGPRFDAPGQRTRAGQQLPARIQFQCGGTHSRVIISSRFSKTRLSCVQTASSDLTPLARSCEISSSNRDRSNAPG